jgi:hypothetical protein
MPKPWPSVGRESPCSKVASQPHRVFAMWGQCLGLLRRHSRRNDGGMSISPDPESQPSPVDGGRRAVELLVPCRAADDHACVFIAMASRARCRRDRRPPSHHPRRTSVSMRTGLAELNDEKPSEQARARCWLTRGRHRAAHHSHQPAELSKIASPIHLFHSGSPTARGG